MYTLDNIDRTTDRGVGYEYNILFTHEDEMLNEIPTCVNALELRAVVNQYMKSGRFAIFADNAYGTILKHDRNDGVYYLVVKKANSKFSDVDTHELIDELRSRGYSVTKLED